MKLHVIEAVFKLDNGAMFGSSPKTAAENESGRPKQPNWVTTRCLLVESENKLVFITQGLATNILTSFFILQPLGDHSLERSLKGVFRTTLPMCFRLAL